VSGPIAISYGKAGVPVYRAYGAPLRGLPRVPESGFEGRDNDLFAVEVDVEVFGTGFLPAYTAGDNSAVVATDSMKNFILRHGLDYQGATLEGFLSALGHGFLSTYPTMESLRLAGRELRFDRVQGALLARAHGDHGTAELRLGRDDEGAPVPGDVRSGRVGLELLKLTGSAFTRFVRDEYTTLPERGDRPLFIHLDVGWRYTDPSHATGDDVSRYAASEQVRDVCAAVFADLVSESIQHLVWEMSERVLERFPQLEQVSFVAQNRTRDPIAGEGEGARVPRVYSDPFPAYGTITLTRARG
jgi:urate oxidase / 2-oxo-4-hydroxy-4-carboxy-5-ureidoimidazoline decarboxylase